MKRVTTQSFSSWNASRVRIDSYAASLSDSRIWLASTILKAIGLINSLKNRQTGEPGEEIEETDTPSGQSPNLEKIKDIKDKLSDILDRVPSGRSREDILTDINFFLAELTSDWAGNFDDCVETLPSDGRTQGGKIATGLKVSEDKLEKWIRIATQIRSEFEEYKKFNRADFISTLKDALDDTPGFIADSVEKYITDQFDTNQATDEGTCNKAIGFVDELIERLNPSSFPECQDGKLPPDDREIPEPPKGNDPPIPKPDPPPPPPTPTGDCCSDLVVAINNLSAQRVDYNRIKAMLMALCNHLTRWIRETRIELKEARQDLKKVLAKLDKNYTWIRDTRIELKEVRTDAKKILNIGRITLERMADIQIIAEQTKEEVIKTRKLVDWNSKMFAIGMAGLASLIGGLGVAIGAGIAALLAALATATKTLTGVITTGFSSLLSSVASLTSAVTTGFLKLQAEQLRTRLQIARGFNRIEDLINPYLNGSVSSFDWVEMTEIEKKKVDEDEKKQQQNPQNLLEELQFFVDTSRLPTDTKDVPNRYVKMKEKTVNYTGYGMDGLRDLLEKTVTVLNDIQGDLKQPVSLSTTKITVPTIAWQPALYKLDKKGRRDYSQLESVKDSEGRTIEGLYQPPDYNKSTPYVQLKEVFVPVGLEELYLYQYNNAIDEFWRNYLDPPIILMPDAWELRPMRYRPQLEFYYVQVLEDGKFNRLVSYTLNVQHYDFERLGKPSISPLPSYEKGGIYGIMELADGSKNLVFGKNKDEVIKVMQAIKEITIPQYAAGVIVESASENNLKWGETDLNPNGSPIKKITVAPVWCDFYSKGRANRTYAIQRDWRVFFDRPNL